MARKVLYGTCPTCGVAEGQCLDMRTVLAGERSMARKIAKPHPDRPRITPIRGAERAAALCALLATRKVDT